MNLEQLLSDWKSDNVIDQNKIDSESVRFAVLHSKYLEMHALARLNVKKIECERATLKRDLYLYYTGKLTKDQIVKMKLPFDPYNGLAKPLKTDMMRWIDANEKTLAVEIKLELARTYLDSCKEIMDTIKWRHQTIKNIIQYKQFEAGY